MHALLPRHKASAIGIAYARYSTEFQHSIVDQIRAIFEFAVKQMIFIPREHIFFDLAVRGCKEHRQGLDQVRTLLSRKAAQVLLIFTTNRLFRKNYKCMKFVEEEVVERGLRCVFVKTGIDTAEGNRWRLPLQLHAMVDEMATTQYAENIRAAHEGLFLKGFVVSAIPYGYMGKTVDGPLTKRHRPRRKLAIDPETSDWVKRIFDWFVVDRLMLARILERLNDEKVPLSPMSNGVYWTHAAMVYLLRNACYRGLWSYGKGRNVWQSQQDYSKRVLRDQPLREAVFEDLRLVSDEIWFKAQELLDAHPQANAGRKPKDGDSTKRPRLLNGLFFCKEHDQALKVGGDYGQHMACEQCRGLPKAKRPLYSYLNRALALRLTCEALVARIREDSDLVTRVIAACRSKAEDFQQGDVGCLVQQRTKAEKTTAQIQFLLRSAGETDLDREESDQKLKQLRAERAGILADIARKEAAIQQPKRIPTEEDVRALVANLEAILIAAAQGDDPEDVGALRQILELLTGGRIELEQMGERRAYRGFLRGRFKLSLLAALQERGGFGGPSPQLESVEIVIDYRELLVAERHIAQVKEMWDAGMQITAIAEKMGIDRHQVTDAIRIWHERNGLPAPPDGRARRATLPIPIPAETEAMMEEIKRLYDEGMLMVEIAQRVGRERTTVRKLLNEWFRVHNVPQIDGRNRRKNLAIKNRPKSPE
jgi:transposase